MWAWERAWEDRVLRRHWNIGDYQVLVWPRWKPFFWRGGTRWRSPIYTWVIFLWPIEVRRFHPRIVR
jgi:hypothetical protein